VHFQSRLWPSGDTFSKHLLKLQADDICCGSHPWPSLSVWAVYCSFPCGGRGHTAAAEGERRRIASGIGGTSAQSVLPRQRSIAAMLELLTRFNLRRLSNVSQRVNAFR